ncbi:cold-shock protein [Marinimicrobium locisalis]|uniref:cold-shock protein n=1 Tax=Marinimicrobium locisalis TaxID=546022 RepID=UPI0032219E10
MAERASGTVKWFNNARGYGFITRGDDSDDVFVHYRNIRGEGYRSLAEGQSVEFELLEGDKGLQADDVIAVA